uniref:Uncharacterized protein n=1 Tax=Cacopsylla melanoneura TaxID=428564 RepID=A0A8D8U9M2_9HEMI
MESHVPNRLKFELSMDFHISGRIMASGQCCQSQRFPSDFRGISRPQRELQRDFFWPKIMIMIPSLLHVRGISEGFFEEKGIFHFHLATLNFYFSFINGPNPAYNISCYSYCEATSKIKHSKVLLQNIIK